jgi:hypothetical protein
MTRFPGHPFFPRLRSRKRWRLRATTRPSSWEPTPWRPYGITRKLPIFGQGRAPPPSLLRGLCSRSALGYATKKKKSSPLMPGCLLTPHLFIYFFKGSESSAVRLGWQGAPGGWPFGSQQRPRERPRIFSRRPEARCGRRE